jgi:nucleoside-diphosphate-sugar epimerase
MSRILITGGSGFFGGILKRRLLAEGHTCHNIDLVADTDSHERLSATQGDIRDYNLLRTIFEQGNFEAVFHCAAQLAHDTIDETMLWTSNVDGTRNIANACHEFKVPKLVNISTNCLWASNLGHDVVEGEPPNPVELYGKSKLAAEELLKEYERDLQVVTIRCPTIIDSGRLGLLAILFEFIQDGRKVWVVGEGSNRYQFIYAQDLATACVQTLDYSESDLFHIGSENVVSLGQVYQSVIDAAGTKARVAKLPKAPTILAMKLAHKLGVSPLGPYHYRMIAEDFIFATGHIRAKLGWKPTLTNEAMMIEAYRYYAEQRAEIHARKDVSAHSKAAPMGIIRLLKWIS